MKNKKSLFFFFLFFLTIPGLVYATVNDSVVLASKMPKKLSDFGFFSNMKLQTPQDGVLPYDLVNPLFTDYTDKLRFIYIPDNGFAKNVPDKVYDFPNGTALIKTFAYLNNHVNSNLPACKNKFLKPN